MTREPVVEPDAESTIAFPLSTALPSWSVRATNLPEHARNPIHTDEGGKAAGFPGALVAGVTVYAYLTRPAAQGWGMRWLDSGTAEVRFLSPVFDGDTLVCAPSGAGDPIELDDRIGAAVRLDATVGGEVRATATVGLAAGAGSADTTTVGHGPLAEGERLRPETFLLEDELADYGLRAGEDFALYADEAIVHPAVWPALANSVVHAQLARGSWIHTRSRIHHLQVGRVGSTALVEASVVDRFTTRSGERCVLDVLISVDAAPVARIEHEALVTLTT